MTPEPRVTVLASRYVSGGCSTIDVDTVPAAEALARTWPTDAHFQVARHATRRGRRRLTSADVGRTPITIDVIAFDIDAPDHAASEQWRDELNSRIAKLPSSPLAYHTRGGARIVWRLAQPFAITTSDGAAIWTARYLACCDWLEGFGVDADRSCSDWQRLFRLPRVVRDGVATTGEIIGNASAIGAIELPEPSEPAPNRVFLRHHPRAAGPPIAHGEAAPRAPGAYGNGSLFKELVGRHLVLAEHPTQPGCWLVHCPRERFHSCGSPGDGSTVYFIAREWLGSGSIVCHHNACAAYRSARAWRRALAELDGVGRLGRPSAADGAR